MRKRASASIPIGNAYDASSTAAARARRARSSSSGSVVPPPARPRSSTHTSAARLGSPRYMTSDGSGNLFLTDNGDHRIYRYNVATGYQSAS